MIRCELQSELPKTGSLTDLDLHLIVNDLPYMDPDTEFNPYIEWLEIDPALCPPNFYDLLGITPFEDDAAVIEKALEERLAHIRTFQTGPRGKYTQNILNELAQARLCLLDAESRARYDEHLRGGLNKPPVAIANLIAADTLPPVDPNAINISQAEPQDQKEPDSPRRSTKNLIIYVSCCLIMVLMVWGIAQWWRGNQVASDNEAEAEKKKSEADQKASIKPRQIINKEEEKKGILPGTNNSFLLTSQNAKIEESHPELIDTSAGQLVGNWKPAKGVIRWEIWINAPGYYEAIVNYSATTNDSFSRFVLETDQDFSKKTKMRKAEQLDKFFEEEVVVLFRKSGAHVIQFFVEGDCGDFRLKSITLRPNRTVRR